MRHEAAFKNFVLYTVPRKPSRRADPNFQQLRERQSTYLFTLAELPTGLLVAAVMTPTQIHPYVIPHARPLHRCQLYEGLSIMCILSILCEIVQSSGCLLLCLPGNMKQRIEQFSCQFDQCRLATWMPLVLKKIPSRPLHLLECIYLFY